MRSPSLPRRNFLVAAAGLCLAPASGAAAAAQGRIRDAFARVRAACSGPAALVRTPGVAPETAHLTVARNRPPWQGTAYRLERDSGLYIERNVQVRLRNGDVVYADLLRPDDERLEDRLPVLISWASYGKHRRQERTRDDGIEDSWLSVHNGFELPNPDYFVREHGYAMLICDARGSWGSDGDLTLFDGRDSEGFYDAIEWAAVQSWCNGKVGGMGLSTYAMEQWRVAALNPPHLACIVPWEGATDFYRERNYRGGIREALFMPAWSRENTVSRGQAEDWLANQKAHPFADCYYAAKQPDLTAVRVPALVGASWSDQGLHTRGALQGFRMIGSPYKWLIVHGRKKWAAFLSPEMRLKQRIFYDHFLKGASNHLARWPRVQMDVRDRANLQAVALRPEDEWPLTRTRFRRVYLDAARAALRPGLPHAAGVVSYDSEAGEAARFDLVFDRDTELTGHAALRLWVESPSETDMDLFVALQKLDASGQVIGLNFASVWDGGPVALGYLRASHRALDAELSRPEQPIHPHTHETPLTPGVPTPVDIEIWPSSTQFRAGEGLRLVIRGRDIYDDMPPGISKIAHETRNRGRHLIHAGGRFDSALLLPDTPPSPAAKETSHGSRHAV